MTLHLMEIPVNSLYSYMTPYIKGCVNGTYPVMTYILSNQQRNIIKILFPSVTEWFWNNEGKQKYITTDDLVHIIISELLKRKKKSSVHVLEIVLKNVDTK